jgi:hypothetical protein
MQIAALSGEERGNRVMPGIDTGKRRSDFAVDDLVYSWDGRVGLKPWGRSGHVGTIVRREKRWAIIKWSDMTCKIIYSHLTHEPTLPPDAEVIMTHEPQKHARLRDDAEQLSVHTANSLRDSNAQQRSNKNEPRRPNKGRARAGWPEALELQRAATLGPTTANS